MNGQQNIVAAGGMGLIAANFWFGGARGTVAQGLFKSGGSTYAYHTELKKIGIEMVTVAAMTLLAGISSSWGTAMVAVIVGLFILWALLHYSGSTQPTTGTQPTH